MRLRDQVAIVTGGGRGIGETIALRFAAEGAAITVAGTGREHLEATAGRLAEGLAKVFADIGVVAHAPAVSTLVGLYFGADLPVDYAGAKRTDERAYAAFFHALLDEGVAIAPGAYEVLFPGLTHDRGVVDEVLSAARRASTTTFG